MKKGLNIIARYVTPGPKAFDEPSEVAEKSASRSECSINLYFGHSTEQLVDARRLSSGLGSILQPIQYLPYIGYYQQIDGVAMAGAAGTGGVQIGNNPLLAISSLVGGSTHYLAMDLTVVHPKSLASVQDALNKVAPAKANDKASKFGFYCCYPGRYNGLPKTDNRLPSGLKSNTRTTGIDIAVDFNRDFPLFQKTVDSMLRACKKVDLYLYFGAMGPRTLQERQVKDRPSLWRNW
jgi:hypothetical protein